MLMFYPIEGHNAYGNQRLFSFPKKIIVYQRLLLCRLSYQFGSAQIIAPNITDSIDLQPPQNTTHLSYDQLQQHNESCKR